MHDKLKQIRMDLGVGTRSTTKHSGSQISEILLKGVVVLLCQSVEVVHYDWMLEDLFVKVGCISKLRTKGESCELFED